MKKFARYTFLCLIPIVTGVVCFIVGNTIGNSTVTYVGMLALVAGLPAFMVIFLIVGLILMSTGKLGNGGKSDSDTTNNASNNDDSGRRAYEPEQRENAVPSDVTSTADETCDGEAENKILLQKEFEQKELNAVNGSSRFESRVHMADYEMRNVAEGMKNAPKWGIAVGVKFFFLLVADLITATVLLIKQIFIGAIVCAALLGIVIITAIIVMSLSRAKAMRGDISKAKKIIEGKVKSCFMIGASTMQTGGNRYQSNNGKTIRIKGITYKVIVIADGEEYGILSKQFYGTDEKVAIAVFGKKRAIITDNAYLDKIKSE